MSARGYALYSLPLPPTFLLFLLLADVLLQCLGTNWELHRPQAMKSLLLRDHLTAAALSQRDNISVDGALKYSGVTIVAVEIKDTLINTYGRKSNYTNDTNQLIILIILAILINTHDW